MEELQTFVDLFDSAGNAMTSFSGMLELIVGLVELLIAIVTGLAALLSTVGTIILVVGSVLLLGALLVAVWLLRAIPTYKVAKNANCGCAKLVWIPLFQAKICTYVLMKASGKDEFAVFNGKIRIKEPLYVFLAYVLVYLFGSSLITFFLGIIQLAPGIGQTIALLSPVLYMLPGIFMGIIEYAILRDVLDVFKPDRKKNVTHALVVTVLSTVVIGWVRYIYLITLMKLKPLPVCENVEQAPVAEAEPVPETATVAEAAPVAETEQQEVPTEA